MCDICGKILGCLTVPHEVLECPYQASLYCSLCGCYGHRKSGCPKETLHIVDSRLLIRAWLLDHGVRPASETHRMKKQAVAKAYLLNPPSRVLFVPKQ
jgi:hypothetical protein